MANVEVVGGTTRVPAVLRQLTELFGCEAGRGLWPWACCVRSAGIEFSTTNGADYVPTPRLMMPCDTFKPTLTNPPLPTSPCPRREPSRTLNAKETVSRGCALQCAMLSPTFRVRDFQVLDSFPYGVQFRWEGRGACLGLREWPRLQHPPPGGCWCTCWMGLLHVPHCPPCPATA